MRSTQLQETVERDVTRQRPAGRRGAVRPAASAPGEDRRRPSMRGPRRTAPATPGAQGSAARWSTNDLAPLVDGTSALAPSPVRAPGPTTLPRDRGEVEGRRIGRERPQLVPRPAALEADAQGVQGVHDGTRLAPGRRLAAAPQRRVTRLTRRGRLAVTTLVSTFLVGVAVTVAALLAAPSSPAAPGGEGAATAPAAVTVAPGDTLWSLAERLAPTRDPRDTVAQMRALNEFDGALRVGQQVLVPLAE